MSGSTSDARTTDARTEPRMTALPARLLLAWSFVGVPLAYGIVETAKKAAVLFTG